MYQDYWAVARQGVGLPFLLGRQVRHFGSILFHDEEEVLLLLVAGGRNVHSRK